jgi:hypothetical protein
MHARQVRSGRLEPGADRVAQAVLCADQHRRQGLPEAWPVGQGPGRGQPGDEVQRKQGLALARVAIDQRELAGRHASGPEPLARLRLAIAETEHLLFPGGAHSITWEGPDAS